MADRARDTENIEFITPYVPVRFDAAATENGPLETVLLRNAETGEEKTLEIGGAFIAIGHRPNSQLVEGQVDTRRYRRR